MRRARAVERWTTIQDDETSQRLELSGRGQPVVTPTWGRPPGTHAFHWDGADDSASCGDGRPSTTCPALC